MNLKQLRELAEASKHDKGYAYCDPQTILALLELVELQHEALQLHGAPFLHHELRYQEAIDAYVAFNKEQ